MSFRDDADGAAMGFKPGETFVQPKITGYRQLSAAEAALMNEVKALGAQIEPLIEKVREHFGGQLDAVVPTVPVGDDGSYVRTPEHEAEFERLLAAEPGRWASIARTHFQEGLMALTRAVAQPGSF